MGPSALPAATPVPTVGSTREGRLLEALLTLADTLVAGHDLTELMGYLVDVCVELLDAADAGLVLAKGDGQLAQVASSSAQAEVLEVLQVHSGRGPCWDCVSTGAVQSVTDITAQAQRWPQFAPLAFEQGFRSVHAVPLRLRERTVGVLTLFRTRPGELAEHDRRVAQALADAATIGVLQQRSARESMLLKDQLEHAKLVHAQLEHALSSRVVIEQAKGLLAQFGGLDMDQAFVELRAYARRNRVGLADLSQGLVDRRHRPSDILTAPVRARKGEPSQGRYSPYQV